MSVTPTVLFETPQFRIASIIESKLQSSIATHIVCGFATVEGVRALKAPICANPATVQAMVVGAGTFQAFEAFDSLLAAGVQSDRLFVHLGHSRLTTAKA